MSEGIAYRPIDPLEKPDSPVIAPRQTRRKRAAAFQLYVLGASAVFVTLAVIAHTVAYFPIDLAVTRALQVQHGAVFAQSMYNVSWLGFSPQVHVLASVVIVSLFLAGLRWEAVVTLLAAGSVGVGGLVKLVVNRPRPNSDLVHVFNSLSSSGFPSGHVLEFTAFCGFLAFLAYTLLKPSWGRTALLALLALLLPLMGLSRIYLGQHWFSDVIGAYLLGSLWLALTIKIYRWGKPRFFAGQPMAPEAPVVTAT